MDEALIGYKSALGSYLHVTKIFTKIALIKELILNYLVPLFYFSATASVVGNNYASVKNKELITNKHRGI